MEQFNKFLLALCMASKVITKEKDAEIIITEKNVTKEKFKTLINQHLLGQKRLGVTPEILRQEDKVMFGGIDIDCPALSEEEKYELALNLQRSLQENYGILALIEKSKSTMKTGHTVTEFLISCLNFQLLLSCKVGYMQQMNSRNL